jgi:branched-chain amino acid transport system substrate-binding protein
MKRLFSLTALAVVFGCGCAQAQYSDGSIKIGVMNDMSGTYSDLSGKAPSLRRGWRSRISAPPPKA